MSQHSTMTSWFDKHVRVWLLAIQHHHHLILSVTRKIRHLTRFCARAASSLRFLAQAKASLKTVRFHIIFGRLLLHLPYRLQVMASLVIYSISLRYMWRFYNSSVLHWSSFMRIQLKFINLHCLSPSAKIFRIIRIKQ